MKKSLRLLAGLLVSSTVVMATPYATYVGDNNQAPADPTTQGWTISGALNQGVDDNGTLGWELNDNNTSDANPTMSNDYGSGNVPQAGDPWSFSVNARVLYGNGSATNLIQWSDGSIRYLCFIYEDAAGNIDVKYWNTSGSGVTLNDYVVNDDGYHTWAIVHDGSSTKLTYDGADVVSLGSISYSTRGVFVGGGSSAGQGALYVAGATFDATLSAGGSTTELGRVFDDHMVLQRNEVVNIYGSDSVNPGTQAISVTFAGQTKNTTTDGDGNWMVTLDPMTANATGQALTVTGSAVKTITDVLIGEVWLAAGQSNMNHTVSTSLDTNTPDATKYPLIRMCNWEGTVGSGGSQVYSAGDFANLTPENFYSGTWSTLDASTVLPQSAVAYYFAQHLVADLNIPVGIVDISRGGTSTEAYISPATHLTEPHLKDAFERPHLCRNLGQWTAPRIYKNIYDNDVNGGNYTHTDVAKPHPHPLAPGFLYDTSMPYIRDFSFKGALWYQGESNAEFTSGKYQMNGNRLSDYQTFVMKTLVSDWRATFDDPDFPFYIVQLTRINASNRAQWPYYREAQQRVATDMEGVEIALVMESGTNGSNVHPHEKEIIGQRLASIARAKEYGQSITYGGPTYKGHTISGNKIILEFDHVGGGLTDNDGDVLRNFEIAGIDRNFVTATATIVGDTVEVTAASVTEPVAVRHAWHMNVDVDFFNADGFSSSSFRTDKWIVAPGRTIRVACIGDSITFGAGIGDSADFYPTQLGNILGTQNFEVRNYGKSGYGIYRSSKRYSNTTEYSDALAWDPDIVICNLGINDITDWGTYTKDQFETEYFSLVDAFAASGQDPLFIQWSNLAPLYPGQNFFGDPNVVLLNDWIREAAANTNAVLLDMETPLSGHADWFPDNIHPNADGAREIAETTFCLLASMGDMDGVGQISEFLAVNTSNIQDEDGDYSDWIELTNTGSGGLCLSDHFLSNDLVDLTRWKLPTSTVLDPGERLLVYASFKNRAENASELHSNFDLSDTGGNLVLVATDGVTVLDSWLNYPAQHANISYGHTSAVSAPMIDTGASLKVHVPVDGNLGTSWTALGFDDSSWTAGSSAVGYDTAVFAFTGNQIWDTIFQNGWSEVNGSGTVETLDDATGTILHYDHSGSGAATTLDGTASTLGGGVTWNDINAGDWTVVVNMKVNDSPNGFVIWLGTDTKRILVYLNNGSTTFKGGSATHTNNDGIFHEYRISHDSSVGKYHVWRDDVLITPAGGVDYDSSATDSRLLFGDSTSGSFGNNYDVEFASISYSVGIYKPLIQTDLETTMKGVNSSAYIRMPFTLTSAPASYDSLTLNVQYDDGFVAYLNGVEVASVNAPGNPSWDSVSSSDLDDFAYSSITLDLTAHLDSLAQGTNILAIHGLNESVGAGRFLISPILTVGASSEELFFQTPTPDSGNGGVETGTGAYSTWKSVHGVTLDDSDIDKDGLSAQMEFFSGSDPNSGSSGYRPGALTVNDGGSDYLGVSFRVANGLSGLSYILETSNDLVSIPWGMESSPVLMSSVDNLDGSSTLNYRLSTSMEGMDRQFLRVKYEYAE